MDPLENPALRVIGQEWKARSRELSDWAMERLVNRKDVWGQYTGKADKANKAVTLPQKDRRGSDMVTLDKLTRHFGSLKRNHLIGLHAQNPDESSKWLAVDIDLHEPEAFDAAEAADRNFTAACGWWEALQRRGYDPLLLDSNGVGGFHLMVLFQDPAPMADVYAFGQTLIADWAARNLDEQPETFPKNERLSEDKMGAWLRLPGLHHTRDHFTRVWSGDEWLENPWLEGNEAIDQILRTIPGPPPPPANLAALPPKKKASGGKRKMPVTPTRRARICVDLDGVLARYDGWRGMEHIGDPVPGAIEFTREMATWADIVIFTSRCRPDRGTMTVEARVRLIRSWLDGHGFVYAEIYTGEGKPMADAFIDDRGVNCRPQLDGPGAFEAAAKLAKTLSKAESP